MPLYEIINLHDPYTFESDDFEVATFTVILLGEGNYGMRLTGPDADEKVSLMPCFALGGSDQWIEETFQCDVQTFFDRVMVNRVPQVVAAMRSVVLGDYQQRFAYHAALDVLKSETMKAKFAEQWHDRYVTSTVDIWRYAQRKANHLEQAQSIIEEKARTRQ